MTLNDANALTDAATERHAESNTSGAVALEAAGNLVGAAIDGISVVDLAGGLAEASGDLAGGLIEVIGGIIAGILS